MEDLKDQNVTIIKLKPEWWWSLLGGVIIILGLALSIKWLRTK